MELRFDIMKEIFFSHRGKHMSETIQIRQERLSPDEYVDFLKRTDLGSQYPKERFDSRIEKLVQTVSISRLPEMKCKL